MSRPPLPSAEHPDDDSDRVSAELLSALADGDADALQAGCALWRDDAQARRTWHTYQLIGDVLRSDDLAQDPAHDQAFLAALHTRLAAEPVVLAPAAVPLAATAAAALPVAVRRRHSWLAPAAVAAGFVAVAGMLVVSRLSTPVSSGPLIAASPAVPSGVATVSTGVQAPSPPPQAVAVGGPIVRDPELDNYLRAHREALGGGAVAVPGGTPRNVETLPASVR